MSCVMVSLITKLLRSLIAFRHLHLRLQLIFTAAYELSMHVIHSQNSGTLILLVKKCPQFNLTWAWSTFILLTWENNTLQLKTTKLIASRKWHHPCCKRSRSGKRSWLNQAGTRCTEKVRSPQAPDCWHRMDCSHHTENQKLPRPEGGTCIERLKGLWHTSLLWRIHC